MGRTDPQRVRAPGRGTALSEIITDDATLHVEVEGAGTPVTVFAHGLTNSCMELAAFTPMAPGTKVRFCFRGHGHSSMPEVGHYRFADFARDLDAVATRYDATCAFGTSLGAAAITHLVGERPDRFERLVFLLPAALDVPLTDHWMFDRTADLLETLPKQEAIEAILNDSGRAETYEIQPALRDFDMLLWQDMNPVGVARAVREVVRDVAIDDRERAARGDGAHPGHLARGRPGPSGRGGPHPLPAHAERGADHAGIRGRPAERHPDADPTRQRLPCRGRVTPGGNVPTTRRATDRRGELLGSLFSVLMASSFAVVVILGKEVQAGRLPFVMLAIRFGGQSVLLFGALALFGRPILPPRGERLWLAVAGTVGYGSESALYFSALNHGGAAAVTLLFYTYPVWVMLVTIGLDRKAPPRTLFAALGLALVGSAVVVLGGKGTEVQHVGIVLAICTSFAYTAYLVTTDRNVKTADPLTAAAWLGVGAATANLVYAFAFRAVVVPPARAVVAPGRHGVVLRRRVRRDAGRAPARGRRAQRDHRRDGAADGRGARLPVPVGGGDRGRRDRRGADPRRSGDRGARADDGRRRTQRVNGRALSR